MSFENVKYLVHKVLKIIVFKLRQYQVQYKRHGTSVECEEL